MTNTQRAVRATLVTGGLGALVWLAVAPLLGGYGRPWDLFALAGLMTGIYALLLCRWSGRRPVAALLPLLVLGLLGPALLRPDMAIVLALVVFSWIRSGVCFPDTVARSVFRELLLCGGAGAVVVFWGLKTPLIGAMGIWLFSLVQALFFILFVPGTPFSPGRPADAFDHAARRIEDLLDGV